MNYLISLALCSIVAFYIVEKTGFLYKNHLMIKIYWFAFCNVLLFPFSLPVFHVSLPLYFSVLFCMLILGYHSFKECFLLYNKNLTSDEDNQVKVTFKQPIHGISSYIFRSEEDCKEKEKLWGYSKGTFSDYYHNLNLEKKC